MSAAGNTYSIGQSLTRKASQVKIDYNSTGVAQEVWSLKIGADKNKVRIAVTPIVGALTGLKITKSMAAGAAHSDYITDSNLDSPFNMMPWSSKTSAGPSLYLTPVGTRAEILLDVTALAEISVWVTGASTGTVLIEWLD